MYDTAVSKLFGSSLIPSLNVRSIWSYCDGRYLHLLCFLLNEASNFHYYSYILINCLILKRYYLLSVIKNKLHSYFMKKPYILSWTTHAKEYYSIDQKRLFRGIMRHVAVLIVYVTINLIFFNIQVYCAIILVRFLRIRKKTRNMR